MKKTLTYLKQYPLHLFILPIYFIGHVLLRFYGLLDPGESFWALLKVSIGIGLCYTLCIFLFKNRIAASSFTTVIGLFFLFFGDIKYSLSRIPVVENLSHYKVLLPILLIFVVSLALRFRSKPPLQLNLYLNILLPVFSCIDIAAAFLPVGKKSEPLISLDIAPAYKDINHSWRVNAPSVYYIVPDGYPSPAFQQEVLGITNNPLDSFLKSRNFYIPENGKSNYSNTAFTLASVFGMAYIPGTNTVYQMAPYYYNKAMLIVQNSPFIKLLRQSGYRILNYSIFDLAGNRALKKSRFLSVSSTQIIFYNSFLNCIKRDLFWQLIPGYIEKEKKKRDQSMRNILLPQRDYNRRVLDSLESFTKEQQPSTPAFLYAHLLMPHYPYFFDSLGNQLPEDSVFSEPLIRNREKFREYIAYTNAQLEKIVDGLLKSSGGKAVIILQSDHGWDDFEPRSKKDAFRNYTAIYFPDGNYNGLYPEMTNVNTFRTVLNKYFGQKLSMLPDKSYYIP